MTSAIPNPVWLLIGTKVTNLSTGPDRKTYLKVMHKWSVCVISGVESSYIEKYRDYCTSFTIIFITPFAIMLISSSQIQMWKIWCASICPWFTYFSIGVAKNGSYLLKSLIIPRKFPLWNEPIISSCPRKAKPRVLRKTVTSIIRRSNVQEDVQWRVRSFSITAEFLKSEFWCWHCLLSLWSQNLRNDSDISLGHKPTSFG